jgi:hypothetical protein
MPFFNDVASHVSAFSSVAAFANAGQIDLSGNGTASVLRGQAVSGGFFPVLGVRSAAGRLIGPSDDSVSAPPVVVLNYGYWKRQFGGSPSAIGKAVRLNNVPFTIIGVADPRFDCLSPGRVYDVWVPLSVLPQINPHPWAKARATDAYSWWLVVIGRLKPGVGRLQAQAAVTTAFRNDMLHGAKPLSKPEDDPKLDALPAQSGLSGSTTEISGELYVLMMAVGIVLLIACANVAGLLLARGATKGNCGAAVAGGSPQKNRAATADGKRFSFTRGRRAGDFVCDLGHACDCDAFCKQLRRAVWIQPRH